MGYFDPLSSRVAMVISGDMAHTHQSTGPYGYSNASQPFDDVSVNTVQSKAFQFSVAWKQGCIIIIDCNSQVVFLPQAVGEWASTLNSTALLETAAGFVDSALSCGYTGLVMLHGFLSAMLVSMKYSFR